MRKVYIADDGKKFDDEFECQDYEWQLNHPNIKEVHFLDKNDNELKDIMLVDTYLNVEKIIVTTDEAIQDLYELGDYMGCDYKNIYKKGVWKFDVDKEEFVLVEDDSKTIHFDYSCPDRPYHHINELTWDNYFKNTYENIIKDNMGFTKKFPYKTGTFVVVDKDSIDINKPKSLRGHLGTIACYQCVDEKDDLMIMVSGYKDNWCGEYLLEEIRLATDEEITIYKNEMGIME